MEFKNKKVLITGGAGFIGSNLAIRLLREGAQVTVADAMLKDMGGNLFNLDPVKSEIQFCKIDFREGEGISGLVNGKDIIFNLMGQVSHQDSITSPLPDMEINIKAQLNLLEACRIHNPSVVIVFSSTRQVYGIPEYLPVDEKHPVHPVDFNGVSNWAGEQYHMLYQKIFGLKAVSLRLTNTYGPRLLIKHSRQGFIGWFLNRALTGKEIRLFGGGTQVRDLDYISDVVEAFLLASQNPDCFGEVFNLSGENASLKEIADTLIRISGKGSVVIEDFPADLKKIDIGNYYGSSEKFRRITGWKAKVHLSEGLKETFEYFRRNQDNYLEISA